MVAYLIKSSACFIILYGIYHLFLQRETFFKVNRIYLLGSLLIGLVLPWLAPYLYTSPSVTLAEIQVVSAEIFIKPFVPQKETIHYWPIIISTIYFLGVLVVLMRTLYGLSKIFMLYKSAQLTKKTGFTLVSTDQIHLPFSFFHFIFISNQIPLDAHIQTVIDHEEVHIKQWHTLDVIFVELMQAIFWFNPIFLLYKKALRQSHEYLADAVICQTQSVSSYTNLLLENAQSGLEWALANHFFHSQIKNRITMMTSKKSNEKAIWKYSLLIPVLVLLIVIFSRCKDVPTSIDNDTTEMTNAKIEVPPTPPVPPAPIDPAVLPDHIEKIEIKKDLAVVTLKDGSTENYNLTSVSDREKFENKYNDYLPSPPPPPPPPSPSPSPSSSSSSSVNKDEVFKVVDDMPRFPGCETISDATDRDNCAKQKMLDYIYSNLKYPEIARTSKIEGQVVAQFIIGKDGVIRDIRLPRTIGGGCDEEVERVLKSMNNMPSKWVPGSQAGQTVSVLYTLPIKFKLEG